MIFRRVATLGNHRDIIMLRFVPRVYTSYKGKLLLLLLFYFFLFHALIF